MKKLLTEKRKRNILVFLILWLLLAIVFVVPLSVAYTDSLSPKGGLQLDSFKSIIVSYILSLKIRVKAFQELYKSNTTNALDTFKFLSAFATFFVLISSNVSESTTMNLFSSTLEVRADFRAALFSFLFILNE